MAFALHNHTAMVLSQTRSLRVTSLLALLGLLAAGCADAHGTDVPQDVEELVDRLASVYCEELQTCRVGPAADPENARALAGLCRETTRTRLLRHTAVERAGLAEGRLTFDPGGAAECVELMRSRACLPSAGPETVHICRFTAGAVPPGGPCNDDVECAAGGNCRFPDGHASCGGVCEPAPPVGATCLSADGCEEGAWCHEGSCVALTDAAEPATEGEPCGLVERGDGLVLTPCREGLVCPSLSSTLLSDPSLCTAPLPEGAPCVPGETPCEPGTVCLGPVDAPTCTAHIVTSEQDASCGRSMGVWCDPFWDLACSDFAGGGQCVRALHIEGQPCEDTPFVCGPTLDCSNLVDGQCTAPLSEGEPCGADRQCASGHCAFDLATDELGTCVDPFCE